MRGNQALYGGVIVFIRMIGPGRVRTRIFQDAVNLRHVLWRESHLPPSQITLLSLACALSQLEEQASLAIASSDLVQQECRAC
jgi:hypothetical protein